VKMSLGVTCVSVDPSQPGCHEAGPPSVNV
jgi:hypothetical protein